MKKTHLSILKLKKLMVFNYWSYCFLALCAFLSCKSRNSQVGDNSITKKDSNTYPSVIIQKHWEKKYDNAVWLFYASNYHSKVLCGCKVKWNPNINDDTTVISLEPTLTKYPYIKEFGDTIEIMLSFTPINDTCQCLPAQSLYFCFFGLKKQRDTVIYRQLCAEFSLPKSQTMLNKKDFMKIPIPEYDVNGNKTNRDKWYAYTLKDGFYPIDVQDSLFRLYVKAHKNQLAPTLLRLCKERNAL